MKPLHLGLLISASIHLAIVIAVWGNFHSAEEKQQPLPLQLAMFAAVKPKPAALPPPPPPPKAAAPKTAKKKAPTEKKPEDDEPSPLLPPVPPSSESKVAERSETDYRNALRSAIEARKRYPAKARRMHWQGTVELAFTVNAAGTIRDLHVSLSSGYPELDRAAMDLVASLSGLLPFPAELKRSEWDFVLPVEYRLE
jgi:periplasmic protein TonB